MGCRHRAFVGAAYIAIVVLAIQWPLRAAVQGPALYVSVTDSKGEPVSGLTAADLVVEINGKAAPVTSVAAAAQPVSIIVVTEGITREMISEVRRMMKAVVTGARAIHPDSRVGLMIQDGAAAPRMHPVNTDASALDAEISRFFESSRNAPLLDSIFMAGQMLGFEKHARRAIVAVTSGSGASVDVMSPERVAKVVRDSGASLWALDLGGRDNAMEAAELRVLSDVTASSGGRRERTTVSSITPLTERIMATLRAQYAITLEDGLPRGSASPKVTVRTKGLKVLAPAWPVVRRDPIVLPRPREL
jgi:hypothetical protein